jgi:hypothetical protein
VSLEGLEKKKNICPCMVVALRSVSDPANSLVNILRTSTDLFLNNQKDALIIQIYSIIKLYRFRASSLPIIRSFLLYIRHW